jgi:hypothetical protein
MRLPKIQFANLPRPVWRASSRVDQRRISLADLLALQEWVKTSPVAPAGKWHKDFGSFILCGADQFPKTVLEKGMKPFGNPVA